MTYDTFNKLVDKLEGTRAETLKVKNARYNPYGDAVGNFHSGAEIMGVTTAQCIWGYTTKHIVALRDKILHNDFHDLDDTLEKIQDIQNYLTFIWCVANEEHDKYAEECRDDSYAHECCECLYKGKAECEEPCRTCKNNFVMGTEEYNNAPLNWKSIK